jgi:hypothetical protein
MSWVTPRDWATSDVPDGDDFDQHISQNILALKFITRRQTDDIIVNASIVMNDLSGLSFYALEGESWCFYANLYVLSNSTADIATTVTATPSTTNSSAHFGIVGSGPTPASWNATQTTLGEVCRIGIGTVNQNVTMSGRVTMGKNGLVKLQGSQAVSTAFNTTFYAGSWMIAHREP